MAVKHGYIVRITDGLFKHSLQNASPLVFSRPIDQFEILRTSKCALVGPGKAKLMDIVAGKYISTSPLALKRGESNGRPIKVEQIMYSGALPTTHFSARYEHFKDEASKTCKEFILDNSCGLKNVNYHNKTTDRYIDPKLYDYLIRKLDLQQLENRCAISLSNGQMRRAKVARSLLKNPDVLLIDEPFVGLDAESKELVSQLLTDYSDSAIVVGLRYQDEVPTWCTDACILDNSGVIFQGSVLSAKKEIERLSLRQTTRAPSLTKSKEMILENFIRLHPLSHSKHRRSLDKTPAIEIKGLDISYRGTRVFENLQWKVAHGSKWHIRGSNGSGKTTLLAVLTGDHPQSWNSKVIINGLPRRAGSTSYFDINRHIGISSPEIHNICITAKDCETTVFELVATGFHDASASNFTPNLHRLTGEQRATVESIIDFFDLDPASRFQDINASDQKLTLFARALIKMPSLLILDEAFSAMDNSSIFLCHRVLERWPSTCLVVSHLPEETPATDHFLHLISPSYREQGSIQSS